MHPLLGIITSTCTASLAPWEVGGAPTGSFFRLDRLGFWPGAMAKAYFAVFASVCGRGLHLRAMASNLIEATCIKLFTFQGLKRNLFH